MTQIQPSMATNPLTRSNHQNGISSWLTTTAASSSVSLAPPSVVSSTTNLIASSPPSPQDIQLLNQAFAEFNAGNYAPSLPLLDTCIRQWQDQPADELAALYQTRADVHLALANADRAYADYDQALRLSQDATNEGLLLGRARAAKALGQTAGAVQDYRTVLKLLGTDDVYDDETTPVEEQILTGIDKNPFAGWEYADCLRSERQYAEAGRIRSATASAFRNIGDRGRSVIALTDAGIDLAGDAKRIPEAVAILQKAVDGTKGVEGRDVRLLQRVISKEGEGRMALAALLWTTNERYAAETVLGDACLRMDQLLNQMDGTPRATVAEAKKGLRYNMEDEAFTVGSLTCSRFRNKDFLTSQLRWPQSLQERVIKLELLQ